MTRSTVIRRPALPAPTPPAWFASPFAAVDSAPVTAATLLGLPAAWRAVNMIANAVATIGPLRALNADELTPVPAPVCDRPLTTAPPFDYWHAAAAALLVRGNFVGLHVAGETELDTQILPVPPDLVHARHDPAGFTVYDVAGFASPLSAEQVIHVRLFTDVGSPWGLSPVEVHRRAVGVALDVQTYASATYRTGGVPSAIINLDRPEVTKDQAEYVAEQWLGMHGGSNRRPAVLPRTMSFQPLAWTPEDAQFLQSRAFSVAEVAFIFGLDPADLGASLAVSAGTMVYANLSQRQAARLEAVTPVMRRFEDAWSDVLPGGLVARFNPDRLYRLTPLEETELHAARIAAGLETVEEARTAIGARQ